jgi:hypothetical protein
MSQPASDQDILEKESTIQLTDRPLVIVLMALGIDPIQFFKAGYKTVFVFSRRESKEIREAWKMNKPIPIEDVRAIFQAATAFNSAVHDD